MRPISALLTVLLATSTPFVRSQTYTQTWYGTGSSVEGISDVCFNSQGHVLAVIMFRQVAVFNGDTLPYAGHLYLTSISPLGDVEWITPVGHHTDWYNVEPSEIVLDEDDNIYFAGRYGTDAHVGDTVLTRNTENNTFIAKFSSAGDLVWVRHVASGLSTNGIDRASNGDLVLGGWTRGSTMIIGTDTVNILGNQGSDIVLVKLDANGDILWYDRAGGSGWYEDYCDDVAFDPNGDILMTGWVRSDAYFDTIQLAAFSTNNNGFVAKYSSNGVAQWVTRTGYGPSSIGVDASGNCYVSGYTYTMGPLDLIISGNWEAWQFLSRLDTDGHVQWIVMPNDVNFGNSGDMFTDDMGNCWITGNHRDSLSLGPFIMTAPGMNSLLVFKADANGTIEWMDLRGSTASTSTFRGTAIACDDSCRLIIGGRYGSSEPWWLGTNPLPITVGNDDAFIARMETCDLVTGTTPRPVAEEVADVVGGEHEEGTEGQRDRGTKGQRDKGTKGRGAGITCRTFLASIARGRRSSRQT